MILLFEMRRLLLGLTRRQKPLLVRWLAVENRARLWTMGVQVLTPRHLHMLLNRFLLCPGHLPPEQRNPVHFLAAIPC